MSAIKRGINFPKDKCHEIYNSLRPDHAVCEAIPQPPLHPQTPRPLLTKHRAIIYLRLPSVMLDEPAVKTPAIERLRLWLNIRNVSLGCYRSLLGPTTQFYKFKTHCVALAYLERIKHVLYSCDDISAAKPATHIRIVRKFDFLLRFNPNHSF